MYALGRSLGALLQGFVVFQIIGLFGGIYPRDASAQRTEEVVVKAKIFSPKWVEEYGGDDPGCAMGRGRYIWRPCGFGSNINNMLNVWVYALAAEGWSDLAVIVDDNQLAKVECSHESKGLVSHGWSCLFSGVPHLCQFDTTEMWEHHMNSSGVSDAHYKKATWFTIRTMAAADFSTPLKLLDTDHLGAKQVMAKYLWGPMTPWLRQDVSMVAHTNQIFESGPFIGLHIRRGDKIRENSNFMRDTEVMAKYLWGSMTPWLRQDVSMVAHTNQLFESGPFIGLHIRRGDKIRENSNFMRDTEAYLAAAVNYLEAQPAGTPPDAIKGIWVASDNTTVVHEVHALAHAYFPSVLTEDIVYVAGGVPSGGSVSGVHTWTVKQDYWSFVYLLADLEQLAAAEVFVGTFSSNMGRLVMLLREGLSKTRSSCISLDHRWNPSRQRSLALD